MTAGREGAGVAGGTTELGGGTGMRLAAVEGDVDGVGGGGGVEGDEDGADLAGGGGVDVDREGAGLGAGGGVERGVGGGFA